MRSTARPSSDTAQRAGPLPLEACWKLGDVADVRALTKLARP
jgi:hypothetical protein